MANHGFSATAIANFAKEDVEYYYMYRFGFDSVLRYTTAPYSITNDKDEDNSYSPSAFVLSAPIITESLKIKPSTANIQMSGASDTILTLTLTTPYRNKELIVYIHEVGSGETAQVFKGFIDDYKTVDNPRAGKSTVQWVVRNHFSNWKAESGRFISHENQIDLYPELDLGLFYAAEAQIDDRFNPDIWFTGRYLAKHINYLRHNDSYILNEEREIGELSEFKVKLPLVYGQRKVEGVRVFADFELVETQQGSGFFRYDYFWEVWALAEGECEGLVSCTFEGEDHDSPRLQDSVQVTFHSGTDTQLVAPEMANKLYATNLWLTQSRLLGICYVTIRYNKDNNALGRQRPPTPVFTVKGKKLYDPRNSQTNYSTNNALVLRDYLSNVIYGKGIPQSELSKFGAGATYCDILQSESNAVGAPDIKTFEFNGFVDTGKSIKKNVENILFTMRGHLPYINGQYKLVIKTENDTGAYHIDEDNLNGSFEVFEEGVSKLANEITYDFIDIDDVGGEVRQQVVEKNAAYLLEDGGRVLRKSYTNKNENNRYRARNRVNTLLKESREQVRVNCTIYSFDAIQVEAGDIVKVSSLIRGWSFKAFRVELLEIKTTGVYFQLSEYEPSVNDWSILPSTADTVNSNRPSPFNVEPPTLLVLTSTDSELLFQADGTIVGGIRVAFERPESGFNILGYNVYLTHPDTPTEPYLAAFLDGVDSLEIILRNVQDLITYTVEVKALNSLGVESVGISDTIMVIGKTGIPDAPTNLQVGSVEIGVVNLFITFSPPADFGYIEYASSLVDNRASATLAGEVKGDTFNHQTLQTRYYWARVIDTSGNASGWFPNSNGGVDDGIEGTPNGTTGVSAWEDITGKPYDSQIHNTTSFRHDFEDDEFVEWVHVDPQSTVAQSTDSYTGAKSGLFKSGNAGSPWDEMPRIPIPERTASVFAGKRIRITLYIKKPATNAAFLMQFQYNNDDGFTATSSYLFPPENNALFASESFEVDVPEHTGAGNVADYISFNGDTSESNKGVLIDNIVIDLVLHPDRINDEIDKRYAGSGINIANGLFSTFEDPDVPIGYTSPLGSSSYETSEFASGSQSIALEKTSGLSSEWAYFNLQEIINAHNIIIEPNSEWIVSWKTKRSASSEASVPVRFFVRTNANEAFTGTSSNLSADSSTEWVRRSFVLSLTDVNHMDSTEMFARFDVGGANGNKVFFDEFMVEKKISLGTTPDEKKPSAFVPPSAIIGAGIRYGRTKTFYQNEPPVSESIGDIWFDGNDNDKIYIAKKVGADAITAGEWELHHDPRVAQAVADIISLGSEVDGKVVTFFRYEPPPVGDFGDLWINRSDNSTLYRAMNNNSDQITSGEWEAVQDEEIANALTNAFDANVEALGARVVADLKIVTFVQDTIPTGDFGDLWFETDNNNQIWRAMSDNSNQKISGEWELYDQAYADWSRIANDDGNKPANNADVTDYDNYKITNNVEEGNILTITRPVGGSYLSNSTPKTGVIDVRLPKKYVSVAIKFVIDIQLNESGGGFTLSVGGYLSSSGTWQDAFAQLHGNKEHPNRVRFGDNGTIANLLIGETTTQWDRPKITIRDVQVGKNDGSSVNYSDWDDNWDVFITSNFGTFNLKADISDALIDAASIRGQGLLATEDDINFYDRASFYYLAQFPTITGFTTVGNVGENTVFGRSQLFSLSSSVTLQLKRFESELYNADHTKVRRCRGEIQPQNNFMNTGESMWFMMGNGVVDSCCIEMRWNNSTSKFDIYFVNFKSDGQSPPFPTSTTSSKITSYSSTKKFKFDIEFIPATHSKLTLENGLFTKTLTTNLTNTSGYIQEILQARVDKTTSNNGSGVLYVFDIEFTQEI